MQSQKSLGHVGLIDIGQREDLAEVEDLQALLLLCPSIAIVILTRAAAPRRLRGVIQDYVIPVTICFQGLVFTLSMSYGVPAFVRGCNLFCCRDMDRHQSGDRVDLRLNCLQRLGSFVVSRKVRHGIAELVGSLDFRQRRSANEYRLGLRGEGIDLDSGALPSGWRKFNRTKRTTDKQTDRRIMRMGCGDYLCLPALIILSHLPSEGISSDGRQRKTHAHWIALLEASFQKLVEFWP